MALNPRTGAIRAMVGGFDFNKQVQPRDAGVAPAGFELQALHLLGGAGEGLHAGHGDQRRAAVLRRRANRQPALGAKNYDGQFDGPMTLQDGLARRRTWCRSASCRPSGRSTRRTGPRASALRPRSTRLTMALGAGSVTPLQMATAYAAVLPTAATASTRCLISAHHRQRRGRWSPGRPRSTSRCTLDARNAFVMNTPAAGGHPLRHGGTRAGHAQARRTCTARPAPPTTRWTPGSPASPGGRGGVDRLRHAAQAGDRETGGGLSLPIWIEPSWTHARSGRAGATPPGWRDQRRRRLDVRRVCQGGGISSLGLEAARHHHRGPSPRPVRALNFRRTLRPVRTRVAAKRRPCRWPLASAQSPTVGVEPAGRHAEVEPPGAASQILVQRRLQVDDDLAAVWEDQRPACRRCGAGVDVDIGPATRSVGASICQQRRRRAGLGHRSSGVTMSIALMVEIRACCRDRSQCPRERSPWPEHLGRARICRPAASRHPAMLPQPGRCAVRRPSDAARRRPPLARPTATRSRPRCPRTAKSRRPRRGAAARRGAPAELGRASARRCTLLAGSMLADAGGLPARPGRAQHLICYAMKANSSPRILQTCCPAPAAASTSSPVANWRVLAAGGTASTVVFGRRQDRPRCDRPARSRRGLLQCRERGRAGTARSRCPAPPRAHASSPSASTPTSTPDASLHLHRPQEGNKFGIAHERAVATYRRAAQCPASRGRHRLPHRLADHRDRTLPRRSSTACSTWSRRWRATASPSPSRPRRRPGHHLQRRAPPAAEVKAGRAPCWRASTRVIRPAPPQAPARARPLAGRQRRRADPACCT